MNDRVKSDIKIIISQMEGFILDNGGIFSDWYVGITEDIKGRLYGYHNVKDTCATVKIPSIEMARVIQKYFIEGRKTDGGTGGGSVSGIYVYAYKKQDYTKERD